MLLGLLKIFGGLALLVLGGEGLVRGAIVLTRRLRVPPLVIGLTIVTYGVAIPELIISARATAQGYSEFAFGTILGSSMSNALLVLGIAALLCPIAVTHRLIRQEGPILLGVAAIFVLLCLDGTLGHVDAAILLLLGIAYSVFIIRQTMREKDEALIADIEKEAVSVLPLWAAILLLPVAVGLLLYGSKILFDGGIEVAGTLGIAQSVVALTVFGFAACLPELVTAIAAARHGRADFILGNVIGSNLFNLTFIAGISGIAYTIPLADQNLLSSMYLLGGVSLLLWMMMTGFRTLARWQGGVLIALYLAYLAVTYYNAAQGS